MTTLTSRYGSAVVTTPSDREIHITRIFDAPAAVIFDAWTIPEHVRQWWGTPEAPLVVCDIDHKVGGDWRYVVRYPDGTEIGWHGTCLELDPPRRMVSTEVFEGFPDAEAVNTLTLTDQGDGSTVLAITVLHSSKENRDGHLESGMEGGLQIVLDRLEDLVRR